MLNRILSSHYLVQLKCSEDPLEGKRKEKEEKFWNNFSELLLNIEMWHCNDELNGWILQFPKPQDSQNSTNLDELCTKLNELFGFQCIVSPYNSRSGILFSPTNLKNLLDWIDRFALAHDQSRKLTTVKKLLAKEIQWNEVKFDFNRKGEVYLYYSWFWRNWWSLYWSKYVSNTEGSIAGLLNAILLNADEIDDSYFDIDLNSRNKLNYMVTSSSMVYHFIKPGMWRNSMFNRLQSLEIMHDEFLEELRNPIKKAMDSGIGDMPKDLKGIMLDYLHGSRLKPKL